VKDLAAALESIEADAFVDAFREAPRSLGIEFEQSDAYTAFFSPNIDILLFNRVIGLGVRTPATQSTIERLSSRYQQSGVKNYGIQLSPYAKPESLVPSLERTGLARRDSWVKMYRDASPVSLVPTDLRVEKIDSSRADVFGETACAGFGFPPQRKDLLSASVGRPDWMHYIAWSDDEPAAAAALYVGGKVGWLGIAATIPKFRKRGGQGALMSQRLRDGIAEGCEWFVTETGAETPSKPNASYRNMIRTGFKLAYERPNYMPPVT